MNLNLNNPDEVAEALVNVRATSARMAQTPTREDLAAKLSADMSESAARVEALRLTSSRSTRDREALAELVGKIDRERKEQMGTLQDAELVLEQRLKELEAERVNAIVAPAPVATVERPREVNSEPISRPVMASSNTLLSSFKVTVNKSDQTKVDVLTGAWVQGGVTKTSSATAIGGVATPYIIVLATVTDGVLQSISVQAAASATQSDTVVLLAYLEYTADNSRIKQITVHHVGDIHKSTGVVSTMANWWYSYTDGADVYTATTAANILYNTDPDAGRVWIGVIGYANGADGNAVDTSKLVLHHFQRCVPTGVS